jgi:hypothetical protein
MQRAPDRRFAGSAVNLERMTLRIARSVEETNQPGADGKSMRFKLPKNEGSRRPIGFDGAWLASSACTRRGRVRQH